MNARKQALKGRLADAGVTRALFGTLVLAALTAGSAPGARPLLLPRGATTLEEGSAESTRKGLVAIGKSLVDDPAKDVWILQYDPERTRAATVRGIVAGAGATLLSPVSGGAYLVRATKAQQLEILEGGEGAIEATRTYVADDKGVAPADDAVKQLLGWAGRATAAVYVVSAFSDVDEREFRGKVAALEGCEVLDGGQGVLRVRMTASGHAAARELPQVAAVGPWNEPKLVNDVAMRAMHVHGIWPSRASGSAGSAGSGVRAVEAERPVVEDFFTKGLLTPTGGDGSLGGGAAARASEGVRAAGEAAGGPGGEWNEDEPGGSAGASLGLTGKGQIVAVFDTGLDTGKLQDLHPDLKGRVVATFAYGRPSERETWSGDWSDPKGHGTHVAGSVLGDGSASGGRIRGAAYEAGLVFQSTYMKQIVDGRDRGFSSGFNHLAEAGFNPYGKLLADAYCVRDAEGRSPRIHSNSWGSFDKDNPSTYDESSRTFDQACFLLKDLLPVVAAGNEGVDKKPPYGVIDPMSLGSPGTAKNILTVGAAENARSEGGYSRRTWSELWGGDYSHEPIAGDYVSRPKSGGGGMAAFSSRGPCNDGRIKPDVVAPGTDVLSLRTRAVEMPGTWGLFDEYYHYSGGTSMATPLVAGTAALVRQWCEEKAGLPDPDGATLKAILCAGAKTLYPGQYGEGQYLEIPKEYPNNVEGWGMVDVANSVANPDGVAVRDGEVLAEGETREYRFRAPGGKPLCILMAYSDYPGQAVAGGLINDLDLTVTGPDGRKHYPNSKNGPDRANNVEGVRWERAPAGVYTATVRATSVPQPMDGKLTDGRADATRFSLVANGAKEAGR